MKKKTIIRDRVLPGVTKHQSSLHETVWCLVVPPPIPRLPCQVRQIPPTVRPVLWACLQIWMLFN